MKIAVLAVQGAFIEHETMLKALGAEVVELRKKTDLELPEDINPDTGRGKHYDGLVLPGGESTVQTKLLKELDMYDTLKRQIQAGLPVLATCAGMILLAEHICNDDRTCFRTIPMTVRRNAYGRQLGSFTADGDVKHIGSYPMRFIRAPYVERISGRIQECGENVPGDAKRAVEVLARVDGNIVAVRCQNQFAMAFHPELTEDTRVHRMFLEQIK